MPTGYPGAGPGRDPDEGRARSPEPPPIDTPLAYHLALLEHALVLRNLAEGLAEPRLHRELLTRGIAGSDLVETMRMSSHSLTSAAALIEQTARMVLSPVPPGPSVAPGPPVPRPMILRRLVPLWVVLLIAPIFAVVAFWLILIALNTAIGPGPATDQPGSVPASTSPAANKAPRPTIPSSARAVTTTSRERSMP